MVGPKALLVAGFPNTGTTITAMVIGQHADVFAAGELADFPHKRHFASHNPCSCGSKAEACAFWLDIRSSYGEQAGDDARLYSLVAGKSGRPLVVDVAHDMDRVEALIGNDALDLQIIHMVRHRHAVLNSRSRRLYDRGIVARHAPQRLQKVMKLGRRHQQFLNRMRRAVVPLGDRVLEVDYDEMCTDPTLWLGRIGAFLQLDLGETAARLAAGEPLVPVPHLIRGNGRLRREDSVVVRRNTDFRTQLSLIDRALYEAGAGMARLGFSG